MAVPAPSQPAYYARRLRTYVSDLWRRREFAWYLGVGNLKARNASTGFGLAWWVLNPLLLAGVYFLVFGVVFAGRRGDDYLGYLVAGMFAFHFTSLAMSGGANSILQNSKLLANLRFPRLILPIAGLIEASAGFVTSLFVLYVIVGPVEGTWPGLSALWLPLVLPVHFLFNLGLSCLAARLAVPFRDVNNLIPYVNRMWLYLSPVIWPLGLLDDMGGGLRSAVEFNPMFSLLSTYRSALLGGPFDSSAFLQFAVWALIIALIGVGAFVKHEGHIVRYL